MAICDVFITPSLSVSAVSGVQRILARIAWDLACVFSTGVPYSPATVMLMMLNIVSASARFPAQMFSALANSASRLMVRVRLSV